MGGITEYIYGNRMSKAGMYFILDQKLGCILLRAVPIRVKNGSKSLIINALLDDRSTQTYLNADIAAKLGLHGKVQKIQVNVMNGTVANFETAPLEFTLRNMNGQDSTVIETFIINDTGDLKTVNWKTINKNWYLGLGSKINMSIGEDYPDFHF